MNWGLVYFLGQVWPLTGEEWVRRVTEKCQPVIDPGWKHSHVQELPCLETLRFGFAQESYERGIEILVHLKKLDLVGLGVPTWS